MRFVIAFFSCYSLIVSAVAQTNLAPSATPSASASSSGSYGPANWNDGILNGSFFGWVGTAIAFPQPAWMQYEWPNPQTINRVVLHNAGTNFAPPAGNAVVFTGTVKLTYWTGTQWQLIQALQGVPGYGAQIDVSFPPITTTKLRLDTFYMQGNLQNPGFDEWEVFGFRADTTDASMDSIQLYNLPSGSGRTLRFGLTFKNRGNVPLVNPTVGFLIHSSPLTGPFTATLGTFAPGAVGTVVHPDSVVADVALNGKQLCAWINATGDINTANDTICITLSGIGTSVSELVVPNPQAYPNPLQDRLYFKHLPTGSTLHFYDMQGRRLAVLTEVPESFVVPEDWPSGLYFLQIQAKNTVQTLRLQKP